MNPLDVPPDPAAPFQPRSGQRGSGFLTGPLQLGTSPSAQLSWVRSREYRLIVRGRAGAGMAL